MLTVPAGRDAGGPSDLTHPLSASVSCRVAAEARVVPFRPPQEKGTFLSYWTHGRLSTNCDCLKRAETWPEPFVGSSGTCVRLGPNAAGPQGLQDPFGGAGFRNECSAIPYPASSIPSTSLGIWPSPRHLSIKTVSAAEARAPCLVAERGAGTEDRRVAVGAAGRGRSSSGVGSSDSVQVPVARSPGRRVPSRPRGCPPCAAW